MSSPILYRHGSPAVGGQSMSHRSPSQGRSPGTASDGANSSFNKYDKRAIIQQRDMSKLSPIERYLLQANAMNHSAESATSGQDQQKSPLGEGHQSFKSVYISSLEESNQLLHREVNALREQADRFKKVREERDDLERELAN
eukprot:GFYU01060479.1.p1 GENE.GFYU01060479.1~~GFYU01060479.1.p1  ORF type:complete len:142 (-),score=4.45 GFYU01060479.1:1-426(-)